MAAVERVAGDLGTKLQVSLGPEAATINNDGFLEKLHNKASQFKSWTENAKAVRVALMDKRYVLDATDRSQLQKCLDMLQKSIKVTSLHSMVERLESISRQLGLKLTAGPSGTDYFINSDMFYVEVVLETSGEVRDVKIAHHSDPVSCPELYEVLKKGDFVEFTRHLEGLSSIYQLNADKKQKSKAYMALQALETDLSMLSQLQCSINDPCNLVHKSPVGILLTRRGGHAMRLTYFISPYDLLDLDSKTLMPLTVEGVIEKQLGYSVMICIESSASHKLQTQSLMSIARTADGKSLPSFAAPTNLNSTTLPASFVMRLDAPMPLATALVRRIHAITQIDCADVASSQPLLSLIMQQADAAAAAASGGAGSGAASVDARHRGLFVTLPDQHHCYFLSGVVDLQGVLVSSIPFTHPTHVPQILIFLRQQALFNVLVGSCIRPGSKQDLETAMMFEVSALSWLHITVAFEHPLEESMATAELDLSDITNVKCKLHTMPSDLPICSDDYASKVIQRCLSIPITMRALIRKAQGQQQQLQRHGGGDIKVNLLPNGGGGGGGHSGASGGGNGSSSSGGGGGGSGLLGHPFSEPPGGGGGGPKFVAADFDVKLNNVGATCNRGGEVTADDHQQQQQQQQTGSVKIETSAEAIAVPLPPDNFGACSSSSMPVTTSGGAISVSSSAAANNCELFSIPPERANPLMTMMMTSSAATTSSSSATTSLLGSALSQAVVAQQRNSNQAQQQQGKPNVMLMNLLNDVPQGQPMTGSASVAAVQQQVVVVKSRKPRKRKAPPEAGAVANSPRSTSGRSPKSCRPSEDESSSKDLPTPETTSGGDFLANFDSAAAELLATSKMAAEPLSSTCGGDAAEVPRGPDDFHQFKSDCDNAGDGGAADDLFHGSSSSNNGAAGSSSKAKEAKKAAKKATKPPPSEDVHVLGKDIEKIPIVVDITGSGAGGGDVATTKSLELPRSLEHPVERRPSVEIIPLGVGGGGTATTATTSGMFGGGATSVKMTKPSPFDPNRKLAAPKQQQQLQQPRRSMSETLNCKGGAANRKERKRKRVDSMDSLDVGGGGGGLKPAKIINMITSLTSGADKLGGAGGILSLMSAHKALDLPVSRPLTLSVKPAPASGSPNISVSVARMPNMAGPPTSAAAAMTKKLAGSPSATPSSSSPTKPVSILKNTQAISGSVNRPKIPMSKLGGAKMAAASSVNDAKVSEASGAKMASSMSPIRVPPPPLGKGRQGLGAKSSLGGAARMSTKPATVKLKPLNMSPAPVTVVTSRNVSPNLSKGGAAAATNTTAAAAATSTVAPTSGSVSPPVLSSSSSSPSVVVVSSPSSATTCTSPLLSKSLVAFTQSAAALTAAAHKASKLFARSRKASLSSVIDKLSMQLQHSGGEFITVEAPAPPPGSAGQPPPATSAAPPTPRRNFDGMTSASARMAAAAAESLAGAKEQKQFNLQQKASGGANGGAVKNLLLSDVGGGAGVKLSSADVVKKAEFTVKPSSQGIKLTVTKTHVSGAGDGIGAAKASGARGAATSGLLKSGSVKSCKAAAAAAGSATGLKPGVNSGPASKKGVAPFGNAASGAAAISKNLSASPGASVTPKSAASVTSLASSPKTTATSPVLPAAAAHASQKTAATSGANSNKVAAQKHPDAGTKLVSGGAAKKLLISDGGGSTRPNTPKSLAAMAPEVTVQLVKRNSGGEDPRQSPIRQFPLVPTSAPKLLLPAEETEAGRAFQRLLQVQQQSNSTSGAFTKVLPGGGNGGGDLNGTSGKLLHLDGIVAPPPPPPDNGKRPATPKDAAVSFRLEVAPPSAPAAPLPGSPPPPPNNKSSPLPVAAEEDNSEDSLVIDCPGTSSSPPKLAAKLLPVDAVTPLADAASSQVVAPLSPPPSVVQKSPPAAPPQQTSSPVTMSTTSSTASSATTTVRSPLVVVAGAASANTPQSLEHSNPSSVAHSSPYDIDDDLMDEALVGLGK